MDVQEISFTDDNHEKLKQANGVKISIRNGSSNHIKGDYSQMQLAKHNRDKYVKQRQGKTFAAANELSGRIMEEREMLSLGTRSRGTSRNTSRAASPTSAKRKKTECQTAWSWIRRRVNQRLIQLQAVCKESLTVKEEAGGLMTPVAEDVRSRESRRITSINHDEDDDELVRVHKKTKTKSTHRVKKKHHTKHTAKSKDKTKKHKKTKNSKDGKGTVVEADIADSGMEDSNVDNSDEESVEPVSGKTIVVKDV